MPNYSYIDATSTYKKHKKIGSKQGCTPPFCFCFVKFGAANTLFSSVKKIKQIKKRNGKKGEKTVLTVAFAGWRCFNFANRRQSQSLCYVNVKRNSKI